ncbi:MAG: amidase [Puniceicoccaceae bacterium]|nr:MAG: amidase [Puniceicoccaceae bacterium]
MKALSIFDWQRLAVDEPAGWRLMLEERLATCLQKTNTSVLSASLMDAYGPGSAGWESSAGPLAGVPYAVKDLFDVKAVPTHASSVLPQLLNKSAELDSELVQVMLALGASCVAKTQMNEFAYGLSGENPHYGHCPHPLLEGCLSGGSSSGSAHMVAAGYLPVAFGTDTGGSIRLPAAWCGLYGIRWVPQYLMQGGFPLAPSFDTLGWFTRSPQEMAYMLQAWFGRDPAQAADAPNGTQATKAAPGAVFLPEALLQSETLAKTRALAEKMGLSFEGDFGELLELLPRCQFAFNVLQSREALVIHEAWLAESGSLYDPAVRARIERARDWTDADVAAAQATVLATKAWFAQYFDKHDFLAMPVCPAPSVPSAEAKPELREQTLQLTTPASIAGLPALTVPVWLDAQRSVGIQFIFKSTAPEVPLSILKLCDNI